MPAGGQDGKRNGHQTKQGNHGNKSISTAEQRKESKGRTHMRGYLQHDLTAESI